MALENESSRTIHQLLSKIATNDQHGENSPYFDGWKAYEIDPFHPTKNPDGIIQMGLAENQLSCDLIEEWIRKNPAASICTTEGVNKFKDIANFQDYHGLPEFRKAVARLMGKIRGDRVSFDPDRIVMAGGATGASELIMFCLADPGDAFLVPTPYYPAFDRDLKWRTGVQLVPVISHSSNNFKITKEALDDAYENARKSNIRVKGVVIANPSNPLGTTVDLDTQTILLKFINDKQIHLVCDEIYSSTVFAGNPPGRNFVSIAEVIEGVENCTVNRNLIHIIYSLSKDMGLPGFRVGIMYSYNDAVVQCGRKMSSFGLVSSQTQHLLASMLSDDEFIHHFLAGNSERLAKRHAEFTNGLREVGITCLTSNAGLFCWMDLRQLLKESTFEAEMVLWKVIINQVKLNVSPGFSFHCNEPGWFRVCFANMDEETLELALKRIKNFMENLKRKEEWRRNNLSRLSLKLSSAGGSRHDHHDHVGLNKASPRSSTTGILSPHSPMSQTQLVN
ncbi:OLC1v1000212C1 [Oldenlandia corymbosa var. corymbosa]|uniref:OLC1v1000212C1 n=1 Tax=Oldenlandia corymbosa var. corymbosa TaxID=529605 RepID=A0AAV1D2C8_OLDCO|nr:OLC1v1000212C1 [Oldenlandia corymbosa var. corymbosa]